jgi:pyridoxal biosynthesis lyase PdxS
LLTIAETAGTNGYRARRRIDPGFAMIRLQGKFGTGMAGRQAMKTFIMAAAMLALIAVPAHAQKHGSVAPGSTAGPPKVVDEKAYKAALDRIPESKEKYDPWGVARPADPAKKPK